MSHYLETATEFTEEQYLTSALREMGFEPEVHSKPVQIRDLDGGLRIAHIVLRSETARTWSDIGFLCDKDGHYQAIIEDMDRAGVPGSQVRGKRFDAAWMGELQMLYEEKRMLGVALQEGYSFQGKTVLDNGEVEMIFQEL